MSHRAYLGGHRWLVISQAQTGGPRGGQVCIAIMQSRVGAATMFPPRRIEETAAWKVAECTVQHAGGSKSAAARKVSEVVAVYRLADAKPSMEIHRDACAWILDHYRDGHRPTRS